MSAIHKECTTRTVSIMSDTSDIDYVLYKIDLFDFNSPNERNNEEFTSDLWKKIIKGKELNKQVFHWMWDVQWARPHALLIGCDWFAYHVCRNWIGPLKKNLFWSSNWAEPAVTILAARHSRIIKNWQKGGRSWLLKPRPPKVTVVTAAAIHLSLKWPRPYLCRILRLNII